MNTKIETKGTRLVWSERGQMGCERPGHAPYKGTDTWIWERRRLMTPKARAEFAADVGHPPECETCRADARDAQRQAAAG